MLIEAYLVVPDPMFSISKVIIIISKFEQVPILGDNMLENTGRIGCSAHHKLILK